jgi:xylulokinase
MVGAGDTACAAFAAQLHRTGERLFTLGTTHVITDHAFRHAPNDLHLQRAYVRSNEWLRHGVTNGGLALGVGARMAGYGTGGEAVAQLVERAFAASGPEIRDAPFFVPHVRAERGPLWLDSANSALLGIDADTDETSVAWSFVEGVLFADRLVLESFDGTDTDQVLLAGAFRQDDSFAQLTADLLETNVRVGNESHLSAVGAALLGAPGDERDQASVSDVTISPRPQLREVIENRWTRFVQSRGELLSHER